jgi:RNA polymerase sigma-70 factor (ECF subfamily)
VTKPFAIGQLSIAADPTGGSGARPMAHAAFAEIYEQYYDGVRRTLRCLGVPAAGLDDAVQEVFLVVHRRTEADPDADVPREWIYAVARRVAWRHYRNDARAERRRTLADAPAEPVSADLALERAEAEDFMIAFLSTLDDDQRAVFVLAEIEELTAKEVGAIVHASPNTVASRLRLARGKLAAALARRNAVADRQVNRGR